MMTDGVLQAMRVASVLSTLGDRHVREQVLTAAHMGVGVALVYTSRHLGSDDEGDEESGFGPAAALVVALLISLYESTWFNWIGAAVRLGYTAIALVIVFRNTTLPTD